MSLSSLASERRKISEDAGLLVLAIRKFCKNQKRLWRQVPVLALKADGRYGFSDDYQLAYRCRLWRIRQISNYICLDVNLLNGDLCIAGDVNRLAKDDEIIGLAFCLDKIDATKIIADLRRTISSTQDYSIVHCNMDRNWRRKRGNEVGLTITD